MFESVNQDGGFKAMTYFTSLLTSLVLHAAILCAVVALPLVFCHSLYPIDQVAWLMDPASLAVRPSVPLPQPESGKAEPKPRAVVVGRIEQVPNKIHIGIPAPDEIPSTAMPDIFGTEDGIPGLGISAQSPADNSWITALLCRPRIELPPPDPPSKPELVRVGGDIQASKLIFKVDPFYPEVARRARVSGVVVLSAVIDEEGNVSGLKVLSGHPLLANAAVEAVSRWKYSPTILNGEPVTVSATVTVVFRLRQ